MATTPLGAIAAGEDTGAPLGETLGPRGTPFGAVPVSPFGETPGPSGTPFGATAAELAVVAIADGDATGDPLGLTFGPRGTPFGAVPLSPLGETPGPRTTPLGAIAAT